MAMLEEISVLYKIMSCTSLKDLTLYLPLRLVQEDVGMDILAEDVQSPSSAEMRPGEKSFCSFS